MAHGGKKRGLGLGRRFRRIPGDVKLVFGLLAFRDPTQLHPYTLHRLEQRFAGLKQLRREELENGSNPSSHQDRKREPAPDIDFFGLHRSGNVRILPYVANPSRFSAGQDAAWKTDPGFEVGLLGQRPKRRETIPFRQAPDSRGLELVRVIFAHNACVTDGPAGIATNLGQTLVYRPFELLRFVRGAGQAMKQLDTLGLLAQFPGPFLDSVFKLDVRFAKFIRHRLKGARQVANFIARINPGSRGRQVLGVLIARLSLDVLWAEPLHGSAKALNGLDNHDPRAQCADPDQRRGHDNKNEGIDLQALVQSLP